MAGKRNKASTPAGRKAVPSVKKTLTFDVETARRLAAYAGLTGQTESRLVVELVRQKLRTFRAFDVEGPEAQPENSPVRLAETPERESA